MIDGLSDPKPRRMSSADRFGIRCAVLSRRDRADKDSDEGRGKSRRGYRWPPSGSPAVNKRGRPLSLPAAVAYLSGLTTEEKAIFLALLVFELTVVARDTYDIGQDGLINPARMRVINEIQHRISAYLVALRQDDAQPDSDDALMRIVLEHPEDTGLQRQLVA